jgi:ATP-dependent DNA helicase RecQ
MVSDAGAGDSVTRVAKRARALLPALAGPQAVLRDDQLAAITALVVDRRRAVVVKRTGWGKSAVYFLATRLLRDAGAGPTLLVSPGKRGQQHRQRHLHRLT